MMKRLIKLWIELKLIKKHMGFSFFLLYLAYIFKNMFLIVKYSSLGVVDREFSEDFTVSFEKISFTFPASALPTAREIYLKNCYNIQHKNLDTCIDLGANRGIVASLLSKFSRKVIAVEMSEDFLNEFEYICGKNKIDNVDYQIGKVTSCGNGNDEISVNQIISANNISSIDFMKIDIEGAEEDVLTRNNEWLKIVKEIGIEVHPPFGVDLKKIESALHDFGFELKIMDMDFQDKTSTSLVEMGYIWATRNSTKS